MKIKILLADDEPVILRGLQKLIDWDKLGAEIIGVASDGNMADSFITEKEPDIFVSDICMPGKSGIELLKMIKERDINTKVIFLSGFQEFSYARDAITFGAIDYILKPIDKEHLEKAVKKAIVLINKDKDDDKMKRQLSGYENESKSSAMEGFIDKLAYGSDSHQLAKGGFATYGIRDEDKYFTVLNLEIDEIKKNISAFSEQEVQLIKFAVFNLLEQYVNNKNTGVVYYKGNNICSIIHNSDQGECRKIAFEIAEYVKIRVKVDFEKSITIGIGNTAYGMMQIVNSYKDSLEALEGRYFFGGNRVISMDDYKTNGSKLDDLINIQKSISKAIIGNNKDVVLSFVEKLSLVIPEVSQGHKDTAISFFISTIVDIKKEIAENRIMVDVINISEDVFINELRNLENWQDVIICMENWITRIYIAITSFIKKNKSMDIVKVKEYIEQNYDKNISLEIAASIACMNLYYFSSYFKKHTGENFKEYLLRVRMEKALKILLTTDCKVYEIAEKVGFNDPRHFSDMFRKYYGCNPASYKNSIKNS